MGPAYHYFTSFGPTPRMCTCLLFPIYTTKRPAPAILPSSLRQLCLNCIKTACTTACGNALSALWTAAGWEDEYRHYRGFYFQDAVDKVGRSRSKAETLALSVDIRQAIEPLMAALGMEPDLECSGCGGYGNCCAVCVSKWNKMEILWKRKEGKEVEAPAVKEEEEEEKEEKEEKDGMVLRPSAFVVHEGGGQEEARKRKKKLWKKGKRAMMVASV